MWRPVRRTTSPRTGGRGNCRTWGLPPGPPPRIFFCSRFTLLKEDSMRTLLRVGAVAPALLALLSAPAALDAQARSAADPARPALIDILLRDIETVEDKLTRLVEAMPAAAYEFRPGEGVRSTGEVVMHIAADNYFLPTPAGIAAPDATGIQAGDYA